MLIKTAVFVKGSTCSKQHPPDSVAEIAFVGKSNVGKSTLINMLLGRRSLVRTSRTPGRTQMINFFLINDEFHFVDLPGYGFAKVPLALKQKWEPMIKDYLSSRKSLKAVILLFDIRRVPNSEDLRMLDWLEEYKIPTIPVITKIDKISSGKRSVYIRKIIEVTGLPLEAFSLFSGLTKEGTEDVSARIESAMK